LRRRRRNDIASKFYSCHSDGFYYYCLGSYHGKGEHYKMSFAQGLLVFLTVIADAIIVWAFLWATDLRRGDKKK
jgi:hypothetical protein